MFRKFITLMLLVLTAGAFYVAFIYLGWSSLEKLAWALASIAAIYSVFSIGFEELIMSRMENGKTRYTIRKAMSLLSIGISLTLYYVSSFPTQKPSWSLTV